MPRVEIPITDLSLNGGVAAASTTADATNDHFINPGGNTGKLVLWAKNTAAAPADLTVVAGADPPAFRSGLGNLTVTVPATNGERLIVLESARFVRKDGTIYIDLASGFTGSLACYRLPKGV